MKRTFFAPEDYCRIVSKLYGKERLAGLNCLAYALGDIRPYSKEHNEYNLGRQNVLGHSQTIETAFEWECKKRSISIKPAQKAELGHRYFRLYGWFDDDNFHIARQEPDGTLVHKLGWRLAPTTTSDEALTEEFGDTYKLYLIIE